MNRLDVIARMQVRNGKLDGFKKHVAEIIRQVKEKDTGTLRYDWFLSNDTDVEILEAYVSSDAWIEHRKNIGEALDVLFSEYADNHNVLVFGEPSPELFEMGNRLMAGRIKWFSFLNGLKS
ncbi:MAG: antibiotic biosynthesis monooxygenase [Gemmatimonadota bacterium]|nr:antibiotic biosynthesis monooxygenase [Gemmatimonadota bacterium]MDH3368821.1 antibiotic biosynthesis monooxygenase [Gemmatimonadota bacterium]MDH3479410.1 antibiotic biosynthesis monooxygenase [Gemmatimonadota bacterium]MDH3569665.1 antibiotic biosynthesis monooxygenase [Gemmatimonadota bacterium]MDH5551140.1 antibiotic biosynthesis monooxygenase [Gemmatimonadota bacterium]